MRKLIILQLKNVNKLKVIFALSRIVKCCADNKFLNDSGAHAIGYFESHCILASAYQHFRLSAFLLKKCKEILVVKRFGKFPLFLLS